MGFLPGIHGNDTYSLDDSQAYHQFYWEDNASSFPFCLLNSTKGGRQSADSTQENTECLRH